MSRSLLQAVLAALLAVRVLGGDLPVAPEVAVLPRVAVVAGHPEAAAAGLAVLQAGGNAVDAAVAVSLSLGVAEPYGSGLGGKLVLLHYESATRQVQVIEAMDAASGTLPVSAFLAAPAADRNEGGPSVAVPGLPAGLWRAHQRWGRRAWADDVAPARELAERGAVVLPKTVAFFAESEARLGRDPEARRLYLPGGRLPEEGMRLPNPDLAKTLARYAAEGPDAIYRGPVADALVGTVRQAGGYLTREDLAGYRARDAASLSVPFAGGLLHASSTPTSGGATLLAVLATLESAAWSPGPLRAPANLDWLGRVFYAVYPAVSAAAGDAGDGGDRLARLLAPASLAEFRRRAGLALASQAAVAADPAVSSTTHFVVVDADRNVVCATQSLSFHFGACLVAPGTGILLNNSLSNFSIDDPAHPNFAAPGRRPRSTIAPALWLAADGTPRLAIGLPGGQRIPTGLAQVLADVALFHRPLVDAVADVRLHFLNGPGGPLIESESGLPDNVGPELERRGWSVRTKEPAGTGLYYGGVNAVEILPDGTLRAIADRRRTNAARGG